MEQTEAINRAFSAKAQEYDQYSRTNPIVRWSRLQVYYIIRKFLPPPATILEINAGTGIDAVSLTKLGYSVHATDIADGMIQKIAEKKRKLSLESLSYSQTSFMGLSSLEGTYDAILSNFGGLNCTRSIKDVFAQFPKLLNPNGLVFLTILNPFCLWELLTSPWSTKTAFRRLNWIRKRPTIANVGNTRILTYYYTPKQIIQVMPRNFKTVYVKGLSSIVPPSYYEAFPSRHPLLYKFTTWLEPKVAHIFPFNRVGDYFVIVFEKEN